VLSIRDKVKIINLLKEGESGKNIAKYDDTSTTSDMNKNSETIINSVSLLE
jgi:hypothetical protein